MERVLARLSRRSQLRADLDYWLGKSMAERVADDFKANKRATGRVKDLADLEALDPPTSE